MKTIVLSLACWVSLTLSAQTEKTYPLNVAESTIHWKGTYSFFFSDHSGTVNFQEGELITTNGNITGGSFVVDMTSITNEEFEERGVGPVEHLRNPDFFDVERFPKSKLVITEVTFFEEDGRHRMRGDFTMKGITKPIEFWPEVHEEEQRIHAKLKLDRTRWGITHNNKLKNDAISDAIELEVTLQF